MIAIKTQISIVIQNRPGVLQKICDSLASHHINIEGFSAYGETDHGIVRLVTSDPDRATEVLTSSKLLVTHTDILAVKLANRPAGLAQLARALSDHRINIDYAYASAAAAGRMTVVYLRVANPMRAAEVLSGKSTRTPRKRAAARAKAKAALAKAKTAPRVKAKSRRAVSKHRQARSTTGVRPRNRR